MADNHFKIHKGLTLRPQSAAPSNPVNGDIYYNSTLEKFQKFEDGSFGIFGTAPDSSLTLENLGLDVTAGSGALTINLKQSDGSTAPASDSPVKVAVQGADGTSKGFSVESFTAAETLVIPSGATLGLIGSTGNPGKIDDEFIYVYIAKSASALQLAVSNVYLDEAQEHNVIAIDDGADDPEEVYADSADADARLRLIGKIQVSLAVAGTWIAPDNVAIWPFQSPENNYNFHYKTTAGQSMGNATDETVVWGTKQVDQYDVMNTGTGIITVPVAGVWIISSNCVMSASTIDYQCEMGVVDSTVGTLQFPRYRKYGTDSRTLCVQTTVIRHFNKGDLITIRIRQNSGGSINMDTGNGDNHVFGTLVRRY